MTAVKPFFGWFVVAGLFLDYMVIVGIVIYTLPLFYPLLMAEYGWSSAQVTLPATLCYFAGAFLTPFVSPLYDKYSIRNFMLLGSFCVVLALGLYGGIAGIGYMLVIYALFALGQIFAGQVPVMVIISRWFKRRRGLAMGIVLTATSAGGAVFPLVVRNFIATGDWRGASLVLGAFAALMLGLPLLLLIRNRPQDRNLLPDGDSAAATGAAVSPAQGEAGGPTLAQVVRTADFYLLAFATGALWFSINGMLQHQSIIMATELGADTAGLPLVISVFFWGAMAGKILFGWMGDRYDKNLVMLLGVALLFIGLLLLRHLGGEQLYPYAVFYGIGFGGTFTMIQLLIADFYSGAHYGRILGVMTMIDVSAGGLGIPALGLLQQGFGSYLPVLDCLVGLTLVIAATVVLLYRRRQAPRLPAGSTAPA